MARHRREQRCGLQRLAGAALQQLVRCGGLGRPHRPHATGSLVRDGRVLCSDEYTQESLICVAWPCCTRDVVVIAALLASICCNSF